MTSHILETLFQLENSRVPFSGVASAANDCDVVDHIAPGIINPIQGGILISIVKAFAGSVTQFAVAARAFQRWVSFQHGYKLFIKMQAALRGSSFRIECQSSHPDSRLRSVSIPGRMGFRILQPRFLSLAQLLSMCSSIFTASPKINLMKSLRAIRPVFAPALDYLFAICRIVFFVVSPAPLVIRSPVCDVV